MAAVVAGVDAAEIAVVIEAATAAVTVAIAATAGKSLGSSS